MKSVNTLLAPVRRTDKQLAVALAAAKQPGSLEDVAVAAGAVSTAVTRAQGGAGMLQVPEAQSRAAATSMTLSRRTSLTHIGSERRPVR